MAGIFQASHRSCLVLRVTVIRGENITLRNWWKDKVDKPDPYVRLQLPKSPNGTRTTKVIKNTTVPKWNEIFEFYMDPELDNVMNVTLMEDNLLLNDELIQTQSVKLNHLKHDVNLEQDLVFNEVMHIYLRIHISLSNEVPKGVRFGRNICKEEIEFRKKRKAFILNAMTAVLGDRGPRNINEVPTVAIIGSGGGFRAMVGLSGTFSALKDMGVMDCSMYFAGLSGSAWYISTLYSNPNWPKIHPVEVNNEIRESIAKNWPRLFFHPSWLQESISNILEKRDRGEPISFTDLFGYLLGDLLLVNRKNPRLSDQKKILEDADVPMPLYACVHVKKDVSAQIFSEWVELSPYEIGMFKYGTYLTPAAFGNKYFCGVCLEEYPEPPLHFLQGCCGSAFTILVQRWLADPDGADEQTEEFKSIRDDGQKVLQEYVNSPKTDHVDNEVSDDDDSDTIVKYFVDKVHFLNTRDGRAAKVHNFLRGLELVFNSEDHAEDEIAVKKLTTDSSCKHIMMCDAGLVFNSPYPLLLREGRQVDLYLSFDYSAREKDDSQPFDELIKAEKWIRANNYPFPPINHEEQIELHGIREYYVFKDDNDPTCPVVIHFPLVNNLFKDFKAPNINRTTEEEKEAGKMSIFDDKDKSYRTFNLHYEKKLSDRLFELTNFNAKVCNEVICDEMAECVAKKRQ